MLMFFVCIIIGFVLKKTGVFPDSAAKVMSKLVVWIFAPALSFSTMARFCTVSTLKTHGTNIAISSFALLIAVILAVLLSKIFVRNRSYERGIYQYALAFANGGYMGDPLVETLFGSLVLSYYKLAYLPFTFLINSWGFSILVPEQKKGIRNRLKKLINPSLVAILAGVVTGLICGAVLKNPEAATAYDSIFPRFIISTLDTLKVCMGPTAMIAAGVTIAKYDLLSLFKNKRVYIVTLLRLVLIPTVILAAVYGGIQLVNLIFGLSIDNTAVILVFFAIAAPVGLNTIVFPEAFGGDPKLGASMAVISHTFCVVTLPLMFALIALVFGGNTWLTI